MPDAMSEGELVEIERIIPHWKPCAKSGKWIAALRRCVAEIRRLQAENERLRPPGYVDVGQFCRE